MKKCILNNSLKLPLLFFCCLIANASFSKTSIASFSGPPTKLCSYTLKESFSYNLPVGVGLNEFSKIDQVKFQNKGFTKRHTFSINTNREYTHSVDYISSKNLYPKWMPHTTENVVYSSSGYRISSKPNKQGLKSKVKDYSYTKHGQETFLLKKESFTNSGLSTHLFTTAEVLNFASQSPTAEIIYQSDGITIVDGNVEISLQQNGNYIISDSDTETDILISPHNLLVSIKQKHEYGVKKVISNYIISEEGNLLPTTITIKTPVISDSGLCVEEVVVKEYSDYKFVGFERGDFGLNLDQGALHNIQSLSRNKDSDLKMYPNPVSNILYLDNVVNTENTRIIISDAKGARIKSTTQCIDENSLSINVSIFDSGIYFINIFSDGNLETFKFIKL